MKWRGIVHTPRCANAAGCLCLGLGWLRGLWCFVRREGLILMLRELRRFWRLVDRSGGGGLWRADALLTGLRGGGWWRRRLLWLALRWRRLLWLALRRCGVLWRRRRDMLHRGRGWRLGQFNLHRLSSIIHLDRRITLPQHFRFVLMPHLSCL